MFVLFLINNQKRFSSSFLDIEHNISWEKFYNRIPTANRYYFIFYETKRTTRITRTPRITRISRITRPSWTKYETRSPKYEQLNVYLSHPLKIKLTYVNQWLLHIYNVYQTYVLCMFICLFKIHIMLIILYWHDIFIIPLS